MSAHNERANRMRGLSAGTYRVPATVGTVISPDFTGGHIILETAAGAYELKGPDAYPVGFEVEVFGLGAAAVLSIASGNGAQTISGGTGTDATFAVGDHARLIVSPLTSTTNRWMLVGDAATLPPITS